MKKKAFSGWKTIFDFTWKQAVGIKNFKLTTVLVAAILLVVGAAISVIMAVVQEDEAKEVSPIGTVHILDESELSVLYVDNFKMVYGEEYPDIEFKSAAGDVQAVLAGLGEGASNDLVLKLTHEDNTYVMSAIIPNGSALKESDAESFLGDFEMCVEQSKLLSSGIAIEKLVYAMSGVSVNTLVAGEAEKSVGEILVSSLMPILVVFAVFMMTVIYGQSITNIVSIEKSSKLMEVMLTTVRPEAMIFGKISATVVVALLQLFLWIGSFVGGFFGGDWLAKTVIYPEYNNAIIEVFKLLQSQEGNTAFSTGAVVLFIICLCLGFLFYSVVAGFIASFVSKAEEVGQCFAYYQMVVMLGYFGSIVLPTQQIEWVTTLIRIVPVTSAFILPGDILVGNVNILEGVLYIGVLLVFTLLVVVAAGKVYKVQVFNRGLSIFDKLKKKK